MSAIPRAPIGGGEGTRSHLRMLRHIIQASPRDAQQARIFHTLNQLRAYDEGLRPADDARQVPALAEPDSFLKAVCARVGGWDVA